MTSSLEQSQGGYGLKRVNLAIFSNFGGVVRQFYQKLRTKFKNIQPLLPKIKNKNKNKIRLKFSKVKNTSSLSHCQMFLYKKKCKALKIHLSQLLLKPWPNLNTTSAAVGFDMNMTWYHHHHPPRQNIRRAPEMSNIYCDTSVEPNIGVLQS